MLSCWARCIAATPIHVVGGGDRAAAASAFDDAVPEAVTAVAELAIPFAASAWWLPPLLCTLLAQLLDSADVPFVEALSLIAWGG